MKPRPFYLGLNMAGTVSAGAYTAGVIDFLIEAMDAWYEERQRQLQQFGTHYDQWTISPHEVQLAVMTGASGGGITAALSAAALSQPFDPVHDQTPAPGSKLNNLFRAWVTGIDLQPLLGHADLDASLGTPVSLLDSTPIQRIAADALKVAHPLPSIRPWVRDGMQLTLTLTNLGGVPYAVEPQTGSDSARTLYYGDRQEYCVLWSNLATGPAVVRLDAQGGGAQWTTLAQAAVATGAFPIVLAPQTLSRTAGEYNHRSWRIANDDPKCDGTGVCQCEENQEMPPQWSAPDPQVVETLNVDGGTTNNSPFECARLALAGLAPVQPSGHNSRDPMLADRAVVNIAPLSSSTKEGVPPTPSKELPSLLGQLVQVLVAQSRMQGENLKLTSEVNMASRWVIAPTTELNNTEPLAGALVGAFGGFISQLFREHDYQLGRRNCQRFLTRYFGLPWDSAIMKQYALSAATQARLDAEYGFPSESKAPVRLFPLIPVLPALRPEITVTRKAIQEDDLKELGNLAVDRLKRVTKGLDLVPGFVVSAAFLFFKGKIRDAIVTRARDELASQGFIQGAS
jgi:hypothetical protein